MSSWKRLASTRIVRPWIGIAPFVALTTVVVYQQVEAENGKTSRWFTKFNETIARFTETPVDKKRELRHIVVPCNDSNFDIYVLGTNHRTSHSNQDVTKLLNVVRPDVIFVELCRGREEMLYDEEYVESEYYTAAEYRRGEEVHEERTTPYLLLGDRPCRISDLRWWEGLETVAAKLFTFLAWPFLLPLRDKLWGYEILINERDTFMAYGLHKSCAYYMDQQSQAKNGSKILSLKKPDNDVEKLSMAGMNTTCAQLKALKREQKSSITLNKFFHESCLDSPPSREKKDSTETTKTKKNPSIVAIIGSNHLEGVCTLLENERVWSPEMMLQVVETERYTRDHPYTLGIVNHVEEYDRGVRVNSNHRQSLFRQ